MYWYVTWKGPKGADGKQAQYGVTVAQPSPAPTFEVGTFNPTDNQMVSGTTTVITGEFDTSTSSVTWHVPTNLIGDPSLAVASDPSLAAIQSPYAVTIVGEGAADAGGLVFVQPADRAPNSGFGPAWPAAATNQSGGGSGGDTTTPTTLTVSVDKHAATAVLTDDQGNPVAGKTIEFAVNGEPAGDAVTDTDGAATVRPHGPLHKGDTVTATFAGDEDYEGSGSSTTV